MKREFILNLAFLVFINLLIKPVFIFGVDLTVQNRATEGDYGLYFALLNLTYIFQLLTDFGIQNFTSIHVSRTPTQLPKYFGNLMLIKALLSTLYFLITLGIASFFLQYRWHSLHLLCVLLLNQVLMQFILFIRANISGLGYYRYDSILSVTDKLIMLATCGSLLFWAPAGAPVSILGFAWAQTAAMATTFVLAYFLLRHLSQRRGIPLFHAGDFALKPGIYKRKWQLLVVLFRRSLPYAVVILLMFAYSRMDGIFLERMVPNGSLHADVYAGAYRLLDACNMLGYLFATLLLPMYSRALRENRAWVHGLTSISLKLVFAGSLFIAATVYFGRAEIISWLMPERASEYRWDTLGILIWVFVPISAIHVLSTLLTADMALTKMNRLFGMAVALDLVLNWLLVPRWLALGSAATTLTVHCFVASGLVYLSFQRFKFGVSPTTVGRFAAYIILLLCSAFFIFKNTNWPIVAKFAGISLAAAIFLLVFRLFSIKSALKLLKPSP